MGCIMEHGQTGIVLGPGLMFGRIWHSYKFQVVFSQSYSVIYFPQNALGRYLTYSNYFSALAWTENERAVSLEDLFLTQLQNTAIYFPQSCIFETVNQQRMSHSSMEDRLMATVKAQQNTRFFSSVSKILKEKPLDPSPQFPAMTLWHTKKVWS